jgi:hypothetical protein
VRHRGPSPRPRTQLCDPGMCETIRAGLFRNVTPTVQSGGRDELGNLAGIGEASGLILGIDECAVDGDVKDTFTIGDQFDLCIKGFFKFCSQTDRLGFVVSLRTIANLHFHRGIPVGM